MQPLRLKAIPVPDDRAIDTSAHEASARLPFALSRKPANENASRHDQEADKTTRIRTDCRNISYSTPRFDPPKLGSFG
jgi:hypothetical protein